MAAVALGKPLIGPITRDHSVAAAEGCVRLPSGRKFRLRGVSGWLNSRGFTTAAQPDAAFGSCYRVMYSTRLASPSFK